MISLLRLVSTALEFVFWVPLVAGRLLLSAVMFNPRLGPLRHVFSFAVMYVLFAVVLVYVFAPLRGIAGHYWSGAEIKYAAERWLATAIYDASGNFVGTFDPRLDSKRDVNYTGKPIELGDYTANPDHKSIPVRDVPSEYWRCLVYHEDRHMGGWLNPFGIDLTGVLKIPASSVMRSIKSRRIRIGVGGSTLPMQLARVIYNTPPRPDEGAFEKLRRKFGEWWIAPVIYYELTQGGDDTDLREWGANHLWLAQRAGGGPLHGVEMTARVVFGKEAQDLTIAEQFVLASAVNKPIILQEGSEQLNKVRIDQWRYITEVRARRCAEVLLEQGETQKSVLFELINMAGGPPDPVVRATLQAAIEDNAPQIAKQAIANPALRANVLIPDVRYGVREEMKNQFGFGWRDHVREVNLPFDVIENRSFREKVKAELPRLQTKLAAKIDAGYALDFVKTPGGDKKAPDIIIAAANEQGEIVRYYEDYDVASYFGSPGARSGETGRYEPARETRAIASVGKMIAAIAIANEGRDNTETLFTDQEAPEAGLESCRKGNLTRGRAARVAFACSLNRPLEWKLAQIGQEPVRRIIRDLGLNMPYAANAGEATPPSTAAVRGLVTASPRAVHQMAGVVLGSLTGNGAQRVRLPTLVKNYDLTDDADRQGINAATDIIPDTIIKNEGRGLIRSLLQAPLCYKTGPAGASVQHGTLKSLANWCAETRGDLKLHFAKTGTSVSDDPHATVDVWLAGGIQFANGPAYSYVVIVGTGNARQPWARDLHAADLAAPLAEVLLRDLAELARQAPKTPGAAVSGGTKPGAKRQRKPDPISAGSPVAGLGMGGLSTSQTPSVAQSQVRTQLRTQVQAQKPVKQPWWQDDSARREIFVR